MSWNAHVWVKWSNTWDNNWESVKEWNQVKRVWSCMGDWDMCLEVNVDSPEKLENFVWSHLRSKKWVQQTHSTWSKEIWNSAS